MRLLPVPRLRAVSRGSANRLTLALTALLGFGLSAYVFSPGYMSNDTIFQLAQALGKAPLNDWHPPVMSLVWAALVRVTGLVSSMALAQLAVFWLSLWGVSIAILRTSHSLRWAMLTYSLALSPVVLTFLGVVWKDVQMAFALLGVVAISLLLSDRPTRRASRWVLFALGLLLLAYATLVRKNAVLAVLPLLILLLRAAFGGPTRRQLITGSAALLLAIVIPSVVIGSVAKPVTTHQATQVMLDDLLHVMSPQELSRVQAPSAVREKLRTSARECAHKKVLMNVYWVCYGEGADGPFTSVANPDDIASVWLDQIPRHLSGYVQYRAELFIRFLFWNRDFFQDGVIANDLGVSLHRPMAKDALKSYVLGWQHNVPWLFSGWLWLALNLLFAAWRGSARFRWQVRLLGLSGALYILGYLPVVPQTDFRYVYWAVISGSVALFLMLIPNNPAAMADSAPDSTASLPSDSAQHA